ncbi:putative vacuolar sorting-associated protein [Clavispora lusitaniae]|uniref:Vacuolar protein sorting-associated protein 28 n=3 Tax=Clavispora lusitaniae TaxID=36911 RepID=C4Y7J1_CLAL4|nr:uncharacterized protein CLUG_04169 [Clavispora lusitaniae ATCC 42720]KAF5209944.1 Vacuolar protein-sorting-associated protein 28 [Clavispora lusitaniae]EEQ40041.1 hypothetical protein CLUG_04169 [Clavispora lusitaniae ATCC 42720]KAF7581995.1 VPS28 family protein [Clavispora lusitaniae]OVF09840.1 putative ESCRT-I subunit protein [Clavispora lusitaniae]QFZ29422.1 putative vacuolar sorting-associated protein [Clavispora lusitaniae]
MPIPPAYAPTSASSYTPAGNGTNFHQEITRASVLTSPIHKAVYESLCEIYSLATTLQVIEKSFLKDYITDKEKYTSTVMRLINQYHTLVQSLGKSPSHRNVLLEILPGVDAECSNLITELQERLHFHVPLAADRLVSGIPATIEHLHTVVDSSSHPTSQSTNTASAASARLVAEATGNFITLMDALKLNYKTKAQLHPLLSNLVISLNDLVTHENDSSTPIDFAGKSKLVGWLIKLNNLGDSELSAEECDSFLSDLDVAYKGFYDSLE